MQFRNVSGTTGQCHVLVFLRFSVRILIRALWTSSTWHSVIATHLRNTTLNSTGNSSGNQDSGSLVSTNRTAKTQYVIKENLFVNHYSFIINSHIYISLVSVLEYKCLISKEFQGFFRYMLWRKPLIHLRNVSLEFSGCCVLINRHFHHVNEATFQVCQWLNGIMPCTGDP